MACAHERTSESVNQLRALQRAGQSPPPHAAARATGTPDPNVAVPAPPQVDPRAERQPGQVVTGVEHNQHIRIAGMPLTSRDQPLHHRADLPGSHLGDVIVAAQPDRVQHRHPRRAARLQRRHERIRPSRYELILTTAAGIPDESGLRQPEPAANAAGH